MLLQHHVVGGDSDTKDTESQGQYVGYRQSLCLQMSHSLALNSNWFLSQSDSQWVQLRVWNFLELKAKQFSRSLFTYLPQSFIYRCVSCTGSKYQKPFRSKQTECCVLLFYVSAQKMSTDSWVCCCCSSLYFFPFCWQPVGCNLSDSILAQHISSLQ